MKLLVAALLLLPLAAHADDKTPKTAQQMHTDDCAMARKQNKTCVLDMTGDKVTGEVARGDGMTNTGLVFKQGPSLIRYRRDFIPEIIKSAEDL